MVFKCQEDSFLKEFTSKVVSCEPAKLKDSEGFNVILSETILFPEGGGQPCDYGTIKDLPVKSVIRKGAEAVLFVESKEPLSPGEDVKQVIDWKRRLDHMQQHSGQHLISAFFDQLYELDTKSWYLGSDTSFIELDGTKNVTQEQLDHIERLCNDLIIEGRKVEVTVTSLEKGLTLKDSKSPKGIPADHVGEVRLISIEGIETDMCCGTHVSNLSQLQAVKMLHIEKSKSKILVHFLIGDRVIRKLNECYNRELQLNHILKGGPAAHLDLTTKCQNNLKTALRNFQKVLKDVAVFEAEKFKQINPQPKFYHLHRIEGIEGDFITTFLKNAPPEGTFYFLTVGENKGAGQFTLRGNPDVVAKFGPAFLELLDGRGNGKGNTFQAKVNNLGKTKECINMLKTHFAD